MPLPINIDVSYGDSPDHPGRKIHQQHHDKLHEQYNRLETFDPATSGGAHPDLAAHDILGLATQAELDAHAASVHGGTHPDLTAHDALGLATQAELDAAKAALAAPFKPVAGWGYRFPGWSVEAVSSSSFGNYLFFYPIFVQSALEIRYVGVEVLTAGAGSVRAGIYSDDAFTVGTLVNDFGVVTLDVAGIRTTPLVSYRLEPGHYWVGYAFKVPATLRTLHDNSFGSPRDHFRASPHSTALYVPCKDVAATIDSIITNGLPANPAPNASAGFGISTAAVINARP